MISVTPPPHLTASQKRIWSYYAPQLVAEGRLPLKARDVLAKYVVALDMVAKLNRKIRSVQSGKGRSEKHPLLSELRQWLNVTRLYESDLILNPAAAVRAPHTVPADTGPTEDDELNDILN
jgi:phage terminase small subunit